METLREQQLLFRAEIIYNSALGRMPGLERWAKSLEGEDGAFARALYDFVLGKNSTPSGRTFGIDSVLRADFLLHYHSKNSIAQ